MERTFQIDKLHLREFHIVKGQIDSPFGLTPDMIAGFHFEAGFDMGFNLDKNLVKADFQVKIESDTKDKDSDQKASGYFEFVYVFEVENLQELAEDKGDYKLKIDNVLANYIASIAYSTSRGVLLTRFQGTALANFIMPIANTQNLIDGAAK